MTSTQLPTDAAWLLLGLAGFHAAHLFTGPAIGRINALLHTLMALAMSAMLLRLQLPILPQLLLFSGAAVWFVIQASARPELKMCATPGDRLKCLYHAASMAAVVLMLLPSTTMGEGMPMSTGIGHHSHIASPNPTLTLTIPDTAYSTATSFFVVVAAVFAWLSLRGTIGRLRGTRSSAMKAILSPTAEATSAIVMAVMFALPLPMN